MRHDLLKKLFLVFLLTTSLTSCSQPPRPNIILITIDTLRPDHLSCYGYQRETSPNIDTLAKDSAVFTQAISQASVTLVSVASLLTATYPTKHGLVGQHPHFAKELSYPNIIGMLEKKDYQTAIFLPYAKFITRWLYKIADHIFRANYAEKSFFEFAKADVLTQEAMGWVEDNSLSSFFVWLHYNEPHASYEPPPPYDSLYVGDELYGTGNRECFRYKEAAEHINDIQKLDYHIAQYDGEIRYVDHWVGKLMDYLKEKDLYDDSLIILSSDHGEAFGEHDLWYCHGATLYDILIRVPLIIKLPRGQLKGKVINRQVRLVDIVPTILDYLDIEIPGHIDGESLMPLLEERPDYSAQFSFSKTDTINALRTEEWKLIYDEKDGHYELYDLKKDPCELNDVYALQKEMADFLRPKMQEILGSYEYTTKELGEEDSQTLELLRSLNYIK